MSEEKQPTVLDKFNMPLGELWGKYRGFLIAFGVFILIFKFRDVIMDWLVADVRKTVDKAEKQDAVLRQEQNEANDKANDLRQQAEDMDKNKSKVDEDWHKK